MKCDETRCVNTKHTWQFCYTPLLRQRSEVTAHGRTGEKAKKDQSAERVTYKHVIRYQETETAEPQAPAEHDPGPT